MSELKAGKIQSGISITPANNMVFDASADNGTFTFKREDGSVLFTVDATGKIDMDGTGVFQQDNILGTVSQTLGVPTGAVIEAGSNANGEYTKFADGLLICTFRDSVFLTATNTLGTLYYSGLKSFTFPAAFVGSAPKVSPAGHYYTNAVWFWVGLPTITTVEIGITSNALNGQGAAAYIAIGRWF